MHNVIRDEGHSHFPERVDASLRTLGVGSRSCIQFSPCHNKTKKPHRFTRVNKFIFETQRCTLHDFMIDMC